MWLIALQIFLPKTEINGFEEYWHKLQDSKEKNICNKKIVSSHLHLRCFKIVKTPFKELKKNPQKTTKRRILPSNSSQLCTSAQLQV